MESRLKDKKHNLVHYKNHSKTQMHHAIFVVGYTFKRYDTRLPVAQYRTIPVKSTHLIPVIKAQEQVSPS